VTTTTAPARLVLPHDADRDEWLAARLDGVTASEIATVLGISPFDSAFNLHWVKRGVIPDDYDNDRLSLGRHLEPWIADRWAEDHPDWNVLPGGLWASSERTWQMATPDRLLDPPVCRCVETCTDPQGPPSLLEIKTSATYDGWGEDGTDEIPAYIRAQVLWQLDVMGLEVGYVVCLFLNTTQIRTYAITYDVVDVDLMRRAAKAFLFNVGAGRAPEVDDHRATTAALKALHPSLEDREVTVPRRLSDQYRAAKDAVKRAKKRADLAENRIRERLGNGRVALDPGGAKVATRLIYDRKGYEVKPTTIDALTPAKQKKEAA
jgi:putative phage-type endonuclease